MLKRMGGKNHSVFSFIPPSLGLAFWEENMLSEKSHSSPIGFMVTHSSDKDASQFSSDPRVVNNGLYEY